MNISSCVRLGHLFILLLPALTLTQAADLQITTPVNLPTATAGAYYSQTLTATGGLPPYVWKFALGALTCGFELDASGVLSGTPASSMAGQSCRIGIRVIDAPGTQVQQTFNLTIQAAAPLVIVTTSPLPDGTVNVPYTASLAASGGMRPYTWSRIAGTLPAGLDLTSTGILSGTPTASGSWSFTAQVADVAGAKVTAQFSIQIARFPLVITSPSGLPDGTVGVAYSYGLAASGGTPPYQNWTNLDPLPQGLTLSAAGTLTGTPSAAGSYTFRVQVRDSAGITVVKTLTLTVTGAAELRIVSPSPLPDATAGAPYTFTFTAEGGTPPYRWRFPLGSGLPDLQLDSTGVLSGAPKASNAGAYTFSITVTDANLQTATKSFTITLRPSGALAILSASPLPDGVVGTNYVVPLAASGGTQPYGWAVIDGALPPGMTLDSRTGVISGTPTTPGTPTFRIEVTDANRAKANKQFTLTITGASSALIIVTASPLPNAFVGQSYRQSLNAVGGKPPYSWRFGLGETVGFLSLDPGAAVLSGTPTPALAGVTLEFNVFVTDSAGQTASKRFLLRVVQVSSQPLHITTASPLPDAWLNLFYMVQLTAEGGALPYRWSVLDTSALPPGIVVDSRGYLYGLPSQTGTYTFTVKVTDAVNGADTKSVQLTVSISEDVIPAGPTAPVAAPTAVGVNPSARRAHFVNRSMYDVFLAAGGGLATDAVSVLDTEHGKLLTPVLVGKAVAGDHQGIAVDAVRQRAYVPNADDNTLSVIDTANGLVSDTVSVGRGPTAAAVDPGRGLVYVTNAQDWSVSVLDPSGNTLGTVATNGQPQLVALDRSTGRAYVVSERTVVALEGTNKRGELAFPSALSLRAIAVDPGSRLYVAERNGLVHIISLAGGALIETGSLRADDLTSALAVDSTTHQLYVANFGASQIKVFSAAGTLLKTCSVPLGPVGIDIDEAGRKAYVANFRANSYSIIDLNSGAVQNSAPVGTHNTDLAFDREARRIYAANYTGNTVGVIDPAAKQVLASWGTGAGPWAIAADGALRQIYTVNVEDNAVAVLSAVDGSFVREKIPLPDATTSAAVALVNSTNHRLYVTQGHAFGQFLTIIDGRRHAIVKSVRTGERPQGIAVDEDAGLIYVANRNSQSVSVLDANSEEVIAEFPTPGILPYSLALDPDWQQLYITAPPNTPSDFHGLVVMDSFSGEILAHITLGVDPEKVVVHRATGHVFVSDTDGSTVTVVDGYDFKVLRVVPTGTWTYAMTVDPDNGVVYVANGNDGTLNVIRDSFDLGAQAPAQRPARRRRSSAAN